jgi:hypothetical protein
MAVSPGMQLATQVTSSQFPTTTLASATDNVRSDLRKLAQTTSAYLWSTVLNVANPIADEPPVVLDFEG